MTMNMYGLDEDIRSSRNDPWLGSPQCRKLAESMNRWELADAMKIFNPFINWEERPEAELRLKLLPYLYSHAGEQDTPAASINDI